MKTAFEEVLILEVCDRCGVTVWNYYKDLDKLSSRENSLPMEIWANEEVALKKEVEVDDCADCAHEASMKEREDILNSLRNPQPSCRYCDYTTHHQPYGKDESVHCRGCGAEWDPV